MDGRTDEEIYREEKAHRQKEGRQADERIHNWTYRRMEGRKDR
jgi:hypothetical protein